MPLAKEDIKEIEELIVKVLSAQPEAVNDDVRYEMEIRERIVRVEEELKHQRELMIESFKQIDKRFEQVEKHFEQMDKRFETITMRIDRFMVWSFATTLTVGGFVVAAIKFLP